MKRTNKFDKLDASQKEFIEATVKKLGTMEKVKAFYNKPCLVAEYAHKVAKDAALPLRATTDGKLARRK